MFKSLEDIFLEIERQKLVAASLSSQCRLFLKPWKVDVHIQKFKAENTIEQENLTIKALSSEEQEQLRAIEGVLQKASKIRNALKKKDIFKEEQKGETLKIFKSTPTNATSASPSTEVSKSSSLVSKNNSANKSSVMTLTQLNNIKSICLGDKQPNGPVKSKLTHKPAYMLAPFKTFVHHKLPNQCKLKVSQQLYGKKTKSSSGRSGVSLVKEVMQQSSIEHKLHDDLEKEIAMCSPNLLGETPDNYAFDETIESLTAIHENGKGEYGADEDKHEDLLNCQLFPPDQVLLADIGKYLEMPASYKSLLAQNLRLRHTLKKIVVKKQEKFYGSHQFSFLQSLESHTNASRNEEFLFLKKTYEILHQFNRLLHISSLVNRVNIAAEASNVSLLQTQTVIDYITEKFKMISIEYSQLSEAGVVIEHNKLSLGDIQLNPSNMFLNGSISSASVVRYQKLKQLHDYQELKEKLITMRLRSLVMGLATPFLEYLKTESSSSRQFLRMYRAVNSIVSFNCRRFPTLVVEEEGAENADESEDADDNFRTE